MKTTNYKQNQAYSSKTIPTELVIDREYVIGITRSFADNSLVTIEREGHLIINANTSFGRNCRIDVRKGRITINTGFTLALGENTLLMLADYPIDGSGTLTGAFSHIEAPVAQIFGSSLNVNGNWSADRVYPQWFAIPDTDDWSEPINKAVNFMRCGEVFLPRGLYPIKHTINIKTGIHLIGASGNKIGGYPDADASINFCSVIQATGNISGFSSRFMITLNAQAGKMPGASWDSTYPSQGTSIKNLSLSNSPMPFTYYGYTDIPEKVAGLSGIFFSGAAEFSDITFSDLAQGIVSDSNVYADMKKVANCSFYGAASEKESGDYAFDLSGLGDGLVFERNHIDSREKALKLYKCMGGRISSNILTRVYLHDCRGITFESNHMEGNSQIEIVRSMVSVKDNHMEVGNLPSIFIHSASKKDGDYDRSIVELSRNCHFFIDGRRLMDNYPDLASRLADICEHDMLIDSNATVRIDNEYRYRVFADLPFHLYPHGIKACVAVYDADGKMTGSNPFEKFNSNSHLFSEKCNIRPGCVIMDSTDEPDITGGISFLKENEWAEWAYGADGCKYTYSYQFLKNGEPVGSPMPCSSSGKCFAPIKEGDKDYVYGAMLVSWGIAETGNHAMVRLIRKSTDKEDTMYADIPLTGSSNLWDNGVSVAGFKWKSEESDKSTNQTKISQL